MEQFDPHDMGKKLQLHPEADQKNFIDVRRGALVLRCGGKNIKGGFCKSLAGAGTDHKGYGRCKYCGGNSTGPKTEEGKQRVSQNSRKHGLYAKYLSTEEQAIYEDLLKKKDLTLLEEISFLKTKLISYLRYVCSEEKAKGREGLIRYRYRGEIVTQYEMGSIEDPNVHQTLEQIRRLVATAKSIDGVNGEDLLQQVNAELRAASQKIVEESWGANTAPQHIAVDSEK
jgi:hypothetical protein